jgi:hypothetical protein
VTNQWGVVPLLVVAAAVATGSGSATRQRAARRPAPSFLVTRIQPSGERLAKRAVLWEGGVDEDTVLLSVDASGQSLDSVRLMIRSGPLVLIGDLPNVTRADRLGRWIAAPDSCLIPVARGAAKDSTVRHAFVPMALARWTRDRNPRRPFLTRVAVAVWSRGRSARAELRIGQPM